MKNIITLITAVLALGVLTPTEAQAGHRSCYSGHRGHFRAAIVPQLIHLAAFSGGHCYRSYDYGYYPSHYGYYPSHYGYASYPRYTRGCGYRNYSYPSYHSRSYGYSGYRHGYRHGSRGHYGGRSHRYGHRYRR